MDAFVELQNILGRLLGPQGCEWDRAQTMRSMRESLLEESCEVIEAIDLGEPHHIQEELGDLFFNALFLCTLAEKEGFGTVNGILQELNDKLVRRHPHVFGEAKVKDVEGVLEQWETIKTSEKGKSHRKSALDGIAKGLPALARAQKILKKLQKKGISMAQLNCLSQEKSSEELVGHALLKLVAESQAKGVEAEQALRATLARVEKEFRENIE